MRKLATLRKISDIQSIDGADAIEVATIDGWKVVVKKNEYSAGALVVYFEIDSWVPHDLAPFLSKGAVPREFNGVKGERLRTIKLRGQVSQGLVLNLSDVLQDKNMKYLPGGYTQIDDFEPVRLFEEGADLTEILGIQKWEAPISSQLQGQVKGSFPSIIPKTDQERIQNCFKDIQKKGNVTYEVTLKLDGSSMTIFRWNDELRVCSRNLELKINEENADNTFVKMAKKIGDQIPEAFAFQGELMGPGIQGNREGFSDHRFYVFDVFDICKHEYLSPENRRAIVGEANLDHVPVRMLYGAPPESVEAGLELAEGPSINHKIREGLVWKCNDDPSFSFKTISNQFLLKGGE